MSVMANRRSMMPTLYKITGPAGEPLHGGSGNWHLPKGKRPGKWMPVVANVQACRAGYHLIPARAIAEWLPSDGKTGMLWEAEGCGASDKDGDKIAFAQARLIRCVGVLDEVSMRLAAAEMAERVLPLFAKMRPNDGRPAAAIQAARDFAQGKIDAAALAAALAAAWAAAWAAAGDAARAAAWDANGRAIIKQAAARLHDVPAARGSRRPVRAGARVSCGRTP